jgi:nucleoside-diphosphate-sugar epimerase
MDLWMESREGPERVLVTGATGLLGREVVRDLVANGYRVHAVDRRPPEPGTLPEGDVWFIETDLHDLGQVAQVMRGCVAVIHLGAIPRPYAHPDDVVFSNNTIATFTVFQAASLLGIDRIAFASSESIYGTAWTPRRFFMQWAPADESHPLRVHDAYALSKETDEATARMFCQRDRISAAALRFAWIGSREAQFAQVRERGDAPTPQDAALLFSYVDIRDAARACRLAIEVAAVRPFGFRAFNIMAADTLVTIPTEEALRRYAPDTEIRSPLPGFSGGFDCSAAKEILGWEPQHSWRDDSW